MTRSHTPQHAPHNAPHRALVPGAYVAGQALRFAVFAGATLLVGALLKFGLAPAIGGGWLAFWSLSAGVAASLVFAWQQLKRHAGENASETRRRRRTRQAGTAQMAQKIKAAGRRANGGKK